MQDYEQVVRDIQNLPWERLDAEGLQELMLLSAFAATEFAESLRITLALYPDNENLKHMATEELGADNLKFEGYTQRGDHASFLWHFLDLHRIRTLHPRAIECGEEYLRQVRSLTPEIRAMSIISRERELSAIFKRILQAKDWSANGLDAYHYYLQNHILFDSSHGGHADMLAGMQVDDRVAVFYRIRLALYQELPFRRDYYSEIAAGYDELHGAEQDEKLSEFLERVELRPNIALLDVGCGTGRSARMLDDLHWHGIEPSAGLIAQAPAAAKARITQGMAEKLPWPDASFDVILSLTALQNFLDPAKGLQEMRRVAKPNAIVLISFLKKSSKKEELLKLLRQTFSTIDEWEQSKDCMFIGRAQPI